MLRTCVSPDGRFIHGLHQPRFRVTNMRSSGRPAPLGVTARGESVSNQINFPMEDVTVNQAQAVFEIANPLPFRGATYIGKQWADRAAADPRRISIKHPDGASLHQSLADTLDDTADKKNLIRQIIDNLPQAMKLALATTSNDPADLTVLAEACCKFRKNPETGAPLELQYKDDPSGRLVPDIQDERLFDLVANNRFLPDDYKFAMVLKPGVQGTSEIVGDWISTDSHVYEYLRGNSYIPWGHYAANMAEDAVRYDVGRLTWDDMRGLRHLYYQRTYLRLAERLGLSIFPTGKALTETALEQLRRAVNEKRTDGRDTDFTATLWGWNYGFDYAPNGYRLHASHQQIHQQYALIPERVPSCRAEASAGLPAFACGDLVQDFVQSYRRRYKVGFFDCYQKAIAGNRRLDGAAEGPHELVVTADDHTMLFVPKAQTSQWELQIMARPQVGNILEADPAMRQSLDRTIWQAMRILRAMGARLITVIELSKRFAPATDGDQRLLYCFLPRLPESPGAFSEAQLRWINGHYPEDFAFACRNAFDRLNAG